MTHANLTSFNDPAYWTYNIQQLSLGEDDVNITLGRCDEIVMEMTDLEEGERQSILDELTNIIYLEYLLCPNVTSF